MAIYLYSYFKYKHNAGTSYDRIRSHLYRKIINNYLHITIREHSHDQLFINLYQEVVLLLTLYNEIVNKYRLAQ